MQGFSLDLRDQRSHFWARDKGRTLPSLPFLPLPLSSFSSLPSPIPFFLLSLPYLWSAFFPLSFSFFPPHLPCHLSFIPLFSPLSLSPSLSLWFSSIPFPNSCGKLAGDPRPVQGLGGVRGVGIHTEMSRKPSLFKVPRDRMTGVILEEGKGLLGVHKRGIRLRLECWAAAGIRWENGF